MINLSAVMSEKEYEKYYSITIFNKSVILDSRKLFNQYQENSVIQNAKFDDDIWIVNDEIHRMSIKFDFDDAMYCRDYMKLTRCSYKLMKKYLKTYAILIMGRVGLQTLQKIVNDIKKILSSEINCEDVYNYDLSKHCARFLEMLPNCTSEIDAILEIIDDLPHPEHRCKNQRKLAEFQKYFELDRILSDIWNNENDTKRLFFFPIWLWWNLTSILPLRPTEFLLLPKDCLAEINGEYFIKIRRTVRKGYMKKKAYNIKGDYEIKSYAITKKLAEEILWYEKMTNNNYQSSVDSLFSVTPHWTYFKRKVSNTAGYYSYSYLSCCLKKLQIEFMELNDEERYIYLGDTRHIAMIGLIVSGGSPSICRELAGHEDINISSNYYSNISKFIECSVYEFTRKYAHENIKIVKSGTHAFVNGIRTVVEDGYCYSKIYSKGKIDDCLNCISDDGEIGDCKQCIYFSDGIHGRMNIASQTEKYKNEVDKNSRYLIQSIERVRKGIGCDSEIKQILLKLQNNSAMYANNLMSSIREEANGKTKENYR